jgi:hypothetical protein
MHPWSVRAEDEVVVPFPSATYYRQQDLLWVLDVDGFPLVVDASLDADASAQDRAEILEMVDSIRMEPI